MIDIAQFKQLKKFDALRDDDEIQTGAVECIQPQYVENGHRNFRTQGSYPRGNHYSLQTPSRGNQ